VIIILTIIFFILDYCLGHDIEKTGIVIEKTHDAANSGTGFGPTTGGNVAVVFTSTPEKFTLFVKLPDGSIDEPETDRETWLTIKKGDEYTYSVRVGLFTGEY
jgi:hypothetical protein